jgi:hypothetical protein
MSQKQAYDDIAYVPAFVRQRIVENMKAMGQEHAVPLIEALASGIALCTITAGRRFPNVRHLRGRGAVVLVGDDVTIAQGPPAFHLASLRKIARHASAWAVVAARPPVELYQAAAALAKAGAIVVLAETQPEHEAAWADWLTKHGRKAAAKMLVTPNAAVYEAAREGIGATRH